MMTKKIKSRSSIARLWVWLNDDVYAVVDHLEDELRYAESMCNYYDQREPKHNSRRPLWLYNVMMWERECYRLRILIDRITGKY